MSKIISAGILVRYQDKFVIGHVTGTEFYDIFKGRTELGENFYDTAVRECYEESSLDFREQQLKYFGLHDYTPKKDLVIFMVDIDDLDIDSLHCSTFMDNGLAEIDGYVLVSYDEMLEKVYPKMKKVLESLELQIK